MAPVRPPATVVVRLGGAGVMPEVVRERVMQSLLTQHFVLRGTKGVRLLARRDLPPMRRSGNGCTTMESTPPILRSGPRWTRPCRPRVTPSASKTGVTRAHRTLCRRGNTQGESREIEGFKLCPPSRDLVS